MRVTYLERPVYGYSQVDDLLNLNTGTARRWIDGYVRRGREYAPVVRERRTESELVTGRVALDGCREGD